jgi:hypothetical protein
LRNISYLKQKLPGITPTVKLSTTTPAGV